MEESRAYLELHRSRHQDTLYPLFFRESIYGLACGPGVEIYGVLNMLEIPPFKIKKVYLVKQKIRDSLDYQMIHSAI